MIFPLQNKNAESIAAIRTHARISRFTRPAHRRWCATRTASLTSRKMLAAFSRLENTFPGAEKVFRSRRQADAVLHSIFLREDLFLFFPPQRVVTWVRHRYRSAAVRRAAAPRVQADAATRRTGRTPAGEVSENHRYTPEAKFFSAPGAGKASRTGKMTFALSREGPSPFPQRRLHGLNFSVKDLTKAPRGGIRPATAGGLPTCPTRPIPPAGK